ncbi:MAG: hypothetical protein HFE77_07215 [Clostridiales bacterium]|nr:hypothetical protein [Clostridiales bacterium]
MDNEKKDSATKPMTLFGAQLRGYKKEDVNRYIWQTSQQHLKETEELEQQIRILTEMLSASEQEQQRVNAMLTESDQIITKQRANIEEQSKKLQEQEAALLQMQQDVEAFEAQINELSKATEKPKDNIQSRQIASSYTTKASKEMHKEKDFTENSKRGNEDFSELTQALQSAKEKIFQFLKK